MFVFDVISNFRDFHFLFDEIPNFWVSIFLGMKSGENKFHISYRDENSVEGLWDESRHNFTPIFNIFISREKSGGREWQR